MILTVTIVLIIVSLVTYIYRKKSDHLGSQHLGQNLVNMA